MAQRIENPDGSITWRYSSFEELLDDLAKSAENPYRLDADLETKDLRDSWMD